MKRPGRLAFTDGWFCLSKTLFNIKRTRANKQKENEENDYRHRKDEGRKI